MVIDLAEQLGYRTLAITDINCTAGIIEFTRLALKKGIKPVAGVDFRNGVQQCFVALAKNNDGFAAINEYLSTHLHAQKVIPAKAPAWKDVVVIYPLRLFLDRSLTTDALKDR